MFIFYKMEYVIAYKMLLKNPLMKKRTFFGNVTCHKHAVLLIFMSICLESMTQHHFVWNVFCNANVKYTSTFQCCYDQRLLFLSLLNVHQHQHTRDMQLGPGRLWSILVNGEEKWKSQISCRIDKRSSRLKSDINTMLSIQIRNMTNALKSNCYWYQLTLPFAYKNTVRD